ncbi:hypothetical protein V491_02029 [Pseudogymnoascus sp. VKM F-3775]|nr:hypothetical protein V491_02029 [Pseudogymnoascus sp. VKM F-3775]
MSTDDATQQQRMRRDDALVSSQIAQMERVIFEDVNTKEASHQVIILTTNQACQKASMEQQGAKVGNHTGVRFENVKIGKGCAVAIVSTKGEEVYGKDIDVGDYTSFNSGQMTSAYKQTPNLKRIKTKALYPISCGRPPEPEGPGSSPTLKDYKTGETKACSISEVLQHPYVEKLSTKIVAQGPLCPSFLVAPEPESKDAEPDDDDGSHSG